MTSITAAPVTGKERIDILDSLRGFAILGILLMNIPYFALPDPTQFTDLAALNETGTINEKVWFVITLALNGTQRALFCLLFGAGIILFTQRQEQKLPGTLSADYYFRRQLWLMVFGLFNFFVLLWIGDFLFPYACFGMLLYTFRKLSPKKLMIAAAICFLCTTARENVDLYRTKQVIYKGEFVQALDTSMTKLTSLQKEQLAAMKAVKTASTIEQRRKEVENSINKMHGDYNTLYKYQTDRGMRFFMIIVYYLSFSHLCFMFLGMAFFKNGFLLGKASLVNYIVLSVLGIGLGMLFTWGRLDVLLEHQFNRFEYTKAMGFDFNELGRVLRALGWFGLIMVLYKIKGFQWIFRMLKPVGQMAFTNYLAQAFLMGIVFYGAGYYGIGMGWFGRMERWEIYLVVAATWILQIVYSHLWLRYFIYGPMEWIWRMLTYWKKLPLKKVKNNDPAVVAN